MAILYHGTPLKNIEAIMETGALYAPILQRIRTVYANKALTRLPARIAIARHYLAESCLTTEQQEDALSVCLTPNLITAVDVAENKKGNQHGGAVFEFAIPDDVIDVLLIGESDSSLLPQTLRMPHSLPLEFAQRVYITHSARASAKHIMAHCRGLPVAFQHSP